VTVPLPVGPLTPYVTPEILTQAPTGISWSTIPPGRDVTYEMRLAEQANICQRATSQVDAYCNQVLRASVDNEQYSGPHYRMTIQNGTGNTRMILQRWPILQVLSVQVAANAVFPRQWRSLQSGMWDIEWPPIGIYGTNAPSSAGEGGQSIVLAPGTTSWCLGRQGYLVRVSYINGWPHTGLTAGVNAGSTQIQVDDCTGWAIQSEATLVTGATGTVYDSGAQEVIQVTAASATAGPGTLTLASPLTFNHDAGVMVSTLPQSVIWATILLCTSIALTRGATATTIQTIPGGGGSGGTGAKEPSDVAGEAELLLNPFRRTI
jgi:hypothetical protein